MITNLCRELCHLMWIWWTGDRIRVSPVEGQLLRLQPGDLLSVTGTDVEVVDRLFLAPDDLCLICRTEFGLAELHVPICSDPEPQAMLWIEAGSERRLTMADVEVWQRGRRREAI